MRNLKLIETILLAVSALVMAAKSIIKFVSYISTIRNKPATSAV